MRRFLALALTLGAPPLAAQQTLLGAWDVTYTAGMHMENGVSTPVPGSGVLTITARGDTLIGELVSKPIGDMPARPPVQMVGSARGDTTTFTSQGKATIMRNGNQREAAVFTTWILSAKGDRLEGSLSRKIEGMSEGSQAGLPVTGTRRR